MISSVRCCRPPFRLAFGASAVALAALVPFVAHAQLPAAGLPGAAVPAAYSAAAHDALIRAGRSGEQSPAQVYATLQAWLQQADAAQRPRLQADLIGTGLRAGNAAEALQQLTVADVAALPDYALADLIAASRQTRRLDLQQAVVERMLRQLPQAWEPQWRRAQLLIDKGDLPAARQALDALEQRASNAPRERAQVLELRGALAEVTGDKIGTYQNYQALRELQPEHRYAARTAAFTRADMEAAGKTWIDPVQAMEGQWKHFSLLERATLAQQAMSRRLAWVMHLPPMAMQQERRQALEQLRQGYERLLPVLEQGEQDAKASGESPQRWHALRMDGVADALHTQLEAGRYQEVISQANALPEGVDALPWYGKLALASAYARVRNPARAVPLFEQAMREGGDKVQMPSDAHIDMAYAYMDSGYYGKARELARKLVAATPGYMRLAPQAGAVNHQYEQVQELDASLKLYSDQVAEAERDYKDLHAAAPGNVTYELGLAKTHQLRGRPRQAGQIVQGLQTDHPDDMQVKAVHARVQMDLNNYAEARETIASLHEATPEKWFVQRLQHEYDLRTAALLQVDVGSGRDGGTLSNRDRRVDARLTSPLIADHWRLFARHLHRGATVHGQKPTFNRTGVGVRWTNQDWELEGEVHHGNAGTGTGFAASAAYHFDDAWRLQGSYDSNSPELPWLARMDRLKARRGDLALSWTPNESRRADLGATRARYADGNRYRAWNLGWDERWLSTADWKFSTQVQAGEERHSRTDVNYFSPARVRHVRVGGRLQWEMWRNGDRRLVQTLEAGVGRVAQSGYATGTSYDARYLHEWTLSPMTTLYYGVGWSRRPFDGVQEKRREAFLGLAIPLR